MLFSMSYDDGSTVPHEETRKIDGFYASMIFTEACSVS
jgi:hypothetical protein